MSDLVELLGKDPLEMTRDEVEAYIPLLAGARVPSKRKAKPKEETMEFRAVEILAERYGVEVEAMREVLEARGYKIKERVSHD